MKMNNVRIMDKDKMLKDIDNKMNTPKRMITKPKYSLRSILLGMGLLVAPYIAMAQPNRYGQKSALENIVMGVSPPEIEWQKTYGGDGLVLIYSVQQTTDGGYILGGIIKPDDDFF